MRKGNPALNAFIVTALSLLYASSSAAAPPPPAPPAPPAPAPAPAPATVSRVEALKAMVDTRAAAAESLAALGDIKAAHDRLKANRDELATFNPTAAEKPLYDAAVKRTDDADTRVKANADSICGAGKPWLKTYMPCFYAGAFLASGSMMWFHVGSLHGGKTGHALVSTAIPAIGIRFPLDQRARFSIDVGLLSMLLSKDVTAGNRSGCRVNDGDFEKRLPCEGNVSLSPLVGLYTGFTAGNSDIGLLTLMPMMGFAKTSLDGSLRFYGGLSVGVVNLSKTINP